jgi:hypothetical protein
MNSFLPAGFLDTPKMGFRIPFVPWMRGPLRGWAEDIVFRDSQIFSFLNPLGVRQLWSNFQQKGDHLGDLMGVLLSFALWSKAAAAMSASRFDVRGSAGAPSMFETDSSAQVGLVALHNNSLVL